MPDPGPDRRCRASRHVDRLPQGQAASWRCGSTSDKPLDIAADKHTQLVLASKVARKCH